MSEVKLTNQSAFTKAAKGMLAQGQMSGGSETGCKYRSTRKGQKLCCGIGFLVTDELGARMDLGVNGDGEDTGIHSLIRLGGVAQVLGHLDTRLLHDIQMVHDSDVTGDWEKILKELAVKYNLKWEL